MTTVGTNVHRAEGPAKIAGTARYVDDIDVPGCLHGVTLRASVPRGVIEAIDLDPDFPWDEYVIVRASDIPGRNVVALIRDDQPILADGVVNHAMEPIALLAHPDRSRAYEALEHLHVRYAPLPPVLTIDESLAAHEVIHGDDNVMTTLTIEKGDVAGGLASAHAIVESGYAVPHQEQVYIENNGMIARVDDDGRIVVTGSMQCPFYVSKALAVALGRSEDAVRVVQAVTGGGFGGKEEYPSILAIHAALLTLAAGRPVKMIYDRHEDMLATTKRHPARVRHRTGVDADGRLLAQEIDVVMDAGAYVTLSPVVLSRGILHATGPYSCPNVRVTARAVATNTPPNGAFRGFGAPQTLFAAELQWERIADATGIDALTLRRRNLVRPGSVLSTGQVLTESVGASEVLERTVAHSDYERRRREHARWNRSRTNPTWRGIGLAVVHHGSGFTGSGEVMLASRAAVTVTRDGRVRVDAASTEIGQGTISLFRQIAADAMEIPIERVEVARPDTSAVPDSGPTVASRTCMVVGALVRDAALKARAALTQAVGGTFPDTPAAFAAAARQVTGDAPERAFTSTYQKPDEITWDETTYRGDAYAVYGYAAAAVDLEVDRRTYEVTVRHVTTAHDVGKAVNPLFVEGQIIGGLTQGLGWALLENAVYEDGALANAQLTNYIIPTAPDTPPMTVDIVEMPYSRGPFGAKGVGEIPMDVPAPAVAAAVRQATGALFTTLPILPEVIADRLNGSGGVG